MFDFRYFSGKNHFESTGMQNYLVFQPDFKFFKMPSAKSNQVIAHGNLMDCQKKALTLLVHQIIVLLRK